MANNMIRTHNNQHKYDTTFQKVVDKVGISGFLEEVFGFVGRVQTGRWREELEEAEDGWKKHARKFRSRWKSWLAGGKRWRSSWRVRRSLWMRFFMEKKQ